MSLKCSHPNCGKTFTPLLEHPWCSSHLPCFIDHYYDPLACACCLSFISLLKACNSQAELAVLRHELEPFIRRLQKFAYRNRASPKFSDLAVVLRKGSLESIVALDVTDERWQELGPSVDSVREMAVAEPSQVSGLSLSASRTQASVRSKAVTSEVAFNEFKGQVGTRFESIESKLDILVASLASLKGVPAPPSEVPDRAASGLEVSLAVPSRPTMTSSAFPCSSGAPAATELLLQVQQKQGPSSPPPGFPSVPSVPRSSTPVPSVSPTTSVPGTPVPSVPPPSALVPDSLPSHAVSSSEHPVHTLPSSSLDLSLWIESGNRVDRVRDESRQLEIGSGEVEVLDSAGSVAVRAGDVAVGAGVQSQGGLPGKRERSRGSSMRVSEGGSREVQGKMSKGREASKKRGREASPGVDEKRWKSKGNGKGREMSKGGNKSHSTGKGLG